VPTDCPSGLVMVTVLRPAVAPTVEMFNVAWVASVYVTLFTVTPPDTVAPMRVRHVSADMLAGVS